MIITLKFGPGICTNQKNWFFDLKKKYTFFVVHCPQTIPLARNAQSTHRQMNKAFSPFQLEPAEIQFSVRRAPAISYRHLSSPVS